MNFKILVPLGLFMFMLACTPTTQLIGTWIDKRIIQLIIIIIYTLKH